MRMDLSFGLYTLEEVFFNIGNKKDFILSSFFKNMSNDLREEKFFFQIIKENELYWALLRR